jgi:hypothetical protein
MRRSVRRARFSLIRNTDATTILPTTTANPPREKVSALCAAKRTIPPNSRILTIHPFLTSSISNKKHIKAPNPKRDETWFGRKNPLVSETDSVPKVMDEAVRVVNIAIDAIPSIGPSIVRSRWDSSLLVIRRREKNRAQTTRAKGPERLKLNCLLNTSK